MPSFRRRASVTDTEREPAKTPQEAFDPTEALVLADEAEAEAAEAEALAAAARARAKAIRLRRAAAETTPVNGGSVDATETAIAPEIEAAPETEIDDATTTDADTDDSDDTAAEVSAADFEIPDVQDKAADSAPRGIGLVLKIVAITLGILGTVALLTLTGIMVWKDVKADRQDEHNAQLNAEYAAAGRQSVVTLMSLDFNNAQEDVKRIIDNTTGQFRTDFESQAEDFVKVAQDSKVVTDVTVNATAVESMDEDSAVVIVAATSRVTNAAGAKQEPRSWRLSVDLQRDGDQIKMSKVEFVP